MAQIKFKRGSSSNITSLVLAEGEPAYTTDTNKLYIGNYNGTKTMINPDMPEINFPVTSVAGRTGAVLLTSSDVGLANVNNTSDINKPISTATQTALDLKENKSNKGIANGYAGLDANAKILFADIPDVILGQVLFGGTWNASTAVATLSKNAKAKLDTTVNTITLTNNTAPSTGYSANEGIYYITSTAGSFASISFDVGDWLISNGTAWQKIDNSDAVTGVKGNAESTYRIGNINITYSNLGTAPIANGGTGATTAAAALTALGAVPTTRTINGKTLSANITLSASDVGALEPNSIIDGGAF